MLCGWGERPEIRARNYDQTSISYCPEYSSKIDLDLLLAYLNSRILDWYFRLGSSNAQINEYQFNNLPCPKPLARAQSDSSKLRQAKDFITSGDIMSCKQLLNPDSLHAGMPAWVADLVSWLVGRIVEIEERRKLSSRSDRARLDPESEPLQHLIDHTLYSCFGLAEEEGRYIEQRLKEMM